MKKTFVTTFLLFSLPALVSAATPIVNNVSGSIYPGQTLSLTGDNMVNSNSSGWDYPESAGSFEGANAAADGWLDSSLVYDTSLYLLGSKSARSDITGIGRTNCPYDNAFGGTTYRAMSRYVRFYVYYGAGFSTLWDNAYYQKMLEYVSPTQVYIQPETGGTSITQLITQITGGHEAHLSLPVPWTTEHWYCVEYYVGANGLTVWVDGVQIGTNSGSINFGAPYPQVGIVNSCPVNGTYSMYMDGFASSSSRIYPAATIVVGDNLDYASANKVVQQVLSLSDTSIQIKYATSGHDLSGVLKTLQGTNCYLFVINNRQERSAAYLLSGGGDTTPPGIPANLTVR